MRGVRRGVERTVTATALVVAFSLPATEPASAARSDDRSRAAARLAADATADLTTSRGDGGLDFVGVDGDGRIDNPSVTGTSTITSAARAHLERYGPALGTTRSGTTLAEESAAPTLPGQQVVRYRQEVDGVPVLGGEVVVTLRAGRDLGSMLSTLSTQTSVAPPTVGREDATQAALTVVGRSTGARRALHADDQGRWLWDPTVLGATGDARGVWQVEVSDGAAVRHLVLIDDRTGAVVLDVDLVQHLDRVVCDNANLPRGSDVPCTAGFARVETGPASGVADVNDAFDLSGETSAFYQSLGVDLTSELGISVGGVKKLASTVRWCYTGEPCPYANAFWNGSQMYYGQGFAGADDVVGHEMTHGIIDRRSQLFYWGQSGAINESLADIMGEIVDQRNDAAGEPADVWDLGEELPGGAIRNLANPPADDQPDRMTSSLYTADDVSYGDNAGVHTNSGVGNKTAYLISQGGSFNGRTVTGIDTGDPALTKTARLYLDVIESLSSGSDFADLAAVLDQSCQDLVAASVAGFTAADCANVHEATLATELRTTPTQAPQPADAADTCPTGTRRVLLDGETSPTTKLTRGTGWVRGSSAVWGSNATSGTESWSDTRPFSEDDATPTSQRLTFTNPVTVPAGQATYLRFQGWYVLDYGTVNGQTGTKFFDTGTVEVSRAGGAFQDTAGLTWVNGPNRRTFTGFGNPAAGRLGFGGDSRGWVASRVALTSFGGQSVRPRFSLNYDDGFTFPGWFIDDVVVYTCDVPLQNTGGPRVVGTPKVGARLTANPGSWSPAAGNHFTYRWLRNGAVLAGATASSYVPKASDLGARLAVRVTGSRTGSTPVTVTSASSSTVQRGTIVAKRPVVKGTVRVGRTVRAALGTWSPSGLTVSYRWLRNGHAITRGATRSRYVLVKADQGKRISVRVTASKAGYTTKSVTSAPTARVRPRS